MLKRSLDSLLLSRNLLAILFLGFSAGLPIALTTSTLQAWFTQSGVNLIAIGTLSFVGMPYVWKFLWAPFMDRFIPPAGGKRRGWIFITQIGLCVALLMTATLSPSNHAVLISVIAVFIAFLSASQDVAIDAYRTDILLPSERGVGSAYYIFAYRLAMLVSGGLALIIADYFGWRLTYQLMAILIGLSTIATYYAPAPVEEVAPAKNIMAIVKASFGDLWKRDAIGIVLLFVIFYKLGDALALSLMSNFLLHGLGFSLTQVGLAYKSVGLIATVSGAFIGGALLIRLSLFRALLYFGLAQAFSTLMFMFLAMAGKNFSFMVSAIFIENFCSGMGTAAFMAFLMSLCNKHYTATQYACLSALSAIGRVCLGPVAGVMVLQWGWINFYAWSFVLSFPGLVLLYYLQGKVSLNAEIAEC
ncbi:MAG: MFS transporter [Gammaproteobacteria bacterium]|nr:MFS transporter [Gammaproteobacteria bacterium]